MVGGRPVEQNVNRYQVLKQPVPLDSCVFCDVGPQDASGERLERRLKSTIPSLTVGNLRHAFVIIHLTRFYQIVAVYTLQANSKEEKV